MDVLHTRDIPDEREWVVRFDAKRRNGVTNNYYDKVTVTVTLFAVDIHQAIERACQYYSESDWIITGVDSYG